MTLSPSSVAAVILASGSSRRFGAENKLLAPLRGAPLAAHSANAVIEAGIEPRFAVVPPGEDDLLSLYTEGGFVPVINETPEAGQSVSLRLGVQAAEASEASAVLIVLADMPFVTAGHLRGLCRAADQGRAAASVFQGRRMPPALFPASLYPSMKELEGDSGARQLFETLDDLAQVMMPPQAGVDIDTPGQLDAIIKHGDILT